MKLIQVATASLNQTPFDWRANRENILEAIELARQSSASVLCLPELCISGYGCEDAFLSPGLLRTSWEILEEIVPHTRGIIVSLGLPIAYRNAVYNAAALVVDGQVAGLVAKRYLAREGIHYEPRWFKAWPVGERSVLTVDQNEYPLGDIYFDCGGVRIAFEICEDAWVGDRPGGNLSWRGVDLILNPSASHFAFGKQATRERFVLEGSRAFGVTYLYSNLLGNEAGRAIYDGGGMIAAGGQMLVNARRFSFRDRTLSLALSDLDLTRMTQARSAGENRKFEDPTIDCVRVPYRFPEVFPGEVSQFDQASWHESDTLKEEEFARAISLGLFDYLRKSRSKGFVVSLSGGADSSAVACLIGLMVRLGTQELGPKGFRDKLHHIDDIVDCQTEQDLTRELLTCAYQSTRNSSHATRDSARLVARSLGATYHEFDVDAIVQAYVQLVSEGIGRSLDWAADDVALQNIQARVRAPGVWLLANLKGALLVSTSNRSEAAVGYATMDGDTCGGLSPIAGIDKAFLKRWLRWLETRGPAGLTPIPELSVVTSQAPTAELRPPETNQTDEADLMPYEVLDAIERVAIRDKKTPTEVFQLMRPRFPQYSKEDLCGWVERFFRLWCRNQWKRERYAPSFHVDDENLDPKTWCRFPILSGGFERELEQLRKHECEAKTPILREGRE